jgi:hypothetical protein
MPIKNLLLRIVGKICKKPWKYSPCHPICTFDDYSVFVRMHKLLVKKELPDSLHEFPFAMSKCIRRGSLPKYIIIIFLDGIGQLVVRLR